MNREILKFKEDLLSSGMFRRVSAIQYRLKDCPMCGNRNWKMYVKIDVNSDEPVLYNCFRCNSHGIVDQKFLDSIGLDRMSIPKFMSSKRLDLHEGVSTKIPDILVTDMDKIDGICEYINSRIGSYPTLTDLQFFHYVGNPKRYVTDYLGNENVNTIKNRYWFQMTNGNIIGRTNNPADEMRWLKYKTNKVKVAGLYRISVPVDFYQPINVIIAEGVMDLIGLYYNYNKLSNAIYIGTMGKNYVKGIQYILDKGIFGTSVNINIFKDPDVPLNKIWIDPNMRSLFKRVDIYENLTGKDYGVTSNMLDINRIIGRS